MSTSCEVPLVLVFAGFSASPAPVCLSVPRPVIGGGAQGYESFTSHRSFHQSKLSRGAELRSAISNLIPTIGAELLIDNGKEMGAELALEWRGAESAILLHSATEGSGVL